jgi:hypothetical protein
LKGELAKKGITRHWVMLGSKGLGVENSSRVDHIVLLRHVTFSDKVHFIRDG